MPANRFNGFKDYGVGIGLRVPHYRHILEKKPVVDWFEIISENYMIDGGRPLEVLDKILDQYRVVQHGVSMYFGSASDPDPEHPDAPRPTAQQDPWHYSIARMVDACAATGALPFYGPFGDISDALGCEDQFRAAFLLGCVGAWSLHPNQIAIAKKVFSPPVDEVKFAKKVLEAIPDGRGVHMIDGKMQDDATWKQCKVMVELAEMLAQKDPELADAYGM